MDDQDRAKTAEGVDHREGTALSQSAPSSLPINPINKLTVQEASELSQSERLDFLMRFNKMSEPVVVGHIRIQGTEAGAAKHWLNRLQTLKGRLLEIPLTESPQSPGVPLGRTQLPDGTLAVLRITVVPNNHHELKKRGKPFAMQAVGAPERLRPLSSIATDGHGKVLIPESVWASEKDAITTPLALEKEKLDADFNRDKAARQKEQAEMDEQIEKKKAFFVKINDAIVRAEKELETIVSDVTIRNTELEALKRRKEHLMSAYRQLCDFAKERANLLLGMDLISQDQFDALLNDAPDFEPPGDMLSWDKDLATNYDLAVSTIHAYMLQQNIIYPRWLVANFLTLLRTNDLIILSGLSGAGKTQIVRSFAEALGGVAHIMPVKPNWTGAEDLLGFFNPLQRTYVRTPFLEALLAASKDPHRLHLICLDEMNLARAEYYFADFLSALEDRTMQAEIPLYSESEANHIQAEVRMLLAAFRGGGMLASSGASQDRVSLEGLLENPETMNQIKAMFGETATESFPAFHGRVRRALSTVLDIPATVLVPTNVRFIGAINVDQTTYSLSPKILDRAHVIRFDNPLRYSIADVRAEVDRHMDAVPRVVPIYMPPQAFMPQRSPYPEYNPNHPAAQWLDQLYKEYLAPLGLDIAFRTIRQAHMYWDLLKDVFDSGDVRYEAIAKNLIVLQKILPKLTIDGKKKAKFRNEDKPWERIDIVREMEQAFRATAKAAQIHPNMHDELQRVRMAAETNDKIFNYWE